MNHNYRKLTIPDVIVIEPKILNDTRGTFSEIFRQKNLDDYLGYSLNFCQENESISYKKVLRGLHYQLPPFDQTKLVRVTNGCILDIAVDIRKKSSTFGQHISVKLSKENRRQLLIPKGFAHGFIVLSEEASVVYKVDNYFNADYYRGIAFDDKMLEINWYFDKNEIILSQNDKNQPRFCDADIFD